MIAALAWVRDHIAGFGGDPAMRDSDGPVGRRNIDRPDADAADARALFRRAIMQSGGFGRGAYASSMAAARADQLLRLLDIDPQRGDALARLRAVDVPRLLVAQGELARANARFAQTMPPFMPVLPSAMTQAAMLGAIADGADGKDGIDRRDGRRSACVLAADPGIGKSTRRCGGRAVRR